MGENWNTVFAVTTWWLWKWRNKRCFEVPEFCQSQAAAFIKIQATKIIRAFAEPSKQEHLPKRSGYGEVLVHWLPPTENWVKLNVDGASRGNPRYAGGGGVFRDYHGKWIGGFSCNLNWCSSMKAELLALLKGLRLAWEGQFSRLEVNMDSQAVVNLIQGPCMNNQAFHFIIKEC